MPFANLGDVKIHFEIYGSEYELLPSGIRKKPTLVAIHGDPGVDHNYYDVPFLANAATFAQVIFISQRGNGHSYDNNPERWNLRQWATDVYQFCNVLGLEKPFIHGVSMGGWVAQLYSSYYPSHAAGIILTDTEAFLDVSEIIKHYEMKGGKKISEIADQYFYQSSPTAMQDYFAHCIPLCSNIPIPAEWMERTILTPEVNAHFKENELLSFNLLEDIKKITAPVLFLTNTTNPLHLFKSAETTAKAMINTKVEFIPFENCGLVSMDAKDKALQHIHSFLNKHFKP